VREYLPLTRRLTLAERVVVQSTSGDVAVQELATIQSSFKDDEALGGAGSLRGVPKNRYVGKGVAFANNELRWDAAEFSLRGHPSRLVLSGFVDAGRVWENSVKVSELASDLHVSYGGGARVAVGPSFVVATDVGHSSQSAAAVYIGLGYLF
jgi:hemolysin activation/secretion protein